MGDINNTPVYFRFDPQPDITVQELATIVSGHMRVGFTTLGQWNQTPEAEKRHFVIVDNPEA